MKKCLPGLEGVTSCTKRGALRCDATTRLFLFPPKAQTER